VTDKQNAEALEEIPTATTTTITGQEPSDEHHHHHHPKVKEAKKNSKTKLSNRKQQSSLDSPLQPPPTLASRFLQNENNLRDEQGAMPSPSTHGLFIQESPLNIVNEQETPLEHDTNTIATTTPKTMTLNATLNKSKTVSAHNTPAVSVANNNNNNEDEDEVNEKDLSEEIRLEFNEDEEEEEEEEVAQVVYVLTDDEDEEDEEKESKENDRELNITVDKSLCVAAPALPCTSFYKSSNITSPPPSTSAQANAATTTTTTIIDEPATTITAANIESVAVEVVKPKPTISAGTGPRIVRPTQKVDTVETILVSAGKSSLVATEQVVKKLVEVVNREAGPRIVKPCASTVSGMHEEEEASKAVAKKISSKVKSSSRMPDFKAIHERNANKLESIADFAERKAAQVAKATTVTKSPHILKQMSLAAMPTTSKVDHVDNVTKPLAKTPMSKFTSRVRNYLSSGSGSASSGNGCVNNVKTSKEIKEGSTPKVVKSLNAGPIAAMQSMASNVLNTFIPRFKNVNINFIIGILKIYIKYD
jgi:hypothetical protein